MKGKGGGWTYGLRKASESDQYLYGSYFDPDLIKLEDEWIYQTIRIFWALAEYFHIDYYNIVVILESWILICIQIFTVEMI